MIIDGTCSEDILMSLAMTDVVTICFMNGNDSWIDCECLEKDSMCCCGLEL